LKSKFDEINKPTHKACLIVGVIAGLKAHEYVPATDKKSEAESVDLF
jgi:hypothetical protein